MAAEPDVSAPLTQKPTIEPVPSTAHPQNLKATIMLFFQMYIFQPVSQPDFCIYSLSLVKISLS
jgi:hypothetical protein